MSENLLLPLEQAHIAWTEENKPLCLRHDDIYFSTLSGIDESRYVFLEANKLPQRWESFKDSTYVIAETGFGTGLNFLLTWQCWKQSQRKPQRLHYISTEKYPLCLEDIRRALDSWPELAEYTAEFLDHYPVLTVGPHRLVLAGGEIILDLMLGDANQQLQAYWDSYRSQKKQLAVHSWFLDGFAPSKNPDMWSPGLFRQIALMSNKNTRFSTFTAASEVRRELEKNGFSVEKAPGFGRKREMLLGGFTDYHRDKQTCEWSVPWHIDSRPDSGEKHAIVVGAGLAGCTSAEALMRRGWNITLIEQHERVASEASGNNQGVLYTRLSHQQSILSDFTLQSYLFSLSYFKNKFSKGELEANIDGLLCGALHLFKDSGHRLHPQLQQFLANTDNLARPLSQEQARKESGIADIGAGLFFPGAGWISPASLCRQISQHPQLNLITNTGPVSVRKVNDYWTVESANKQIIGTSPVVIIASGTGSNSFEQLEWLPLQKIRGQTSQLSANTYSQHLKTVLCHEGYIAPENCGQHCIGATFDIGDEEQGLRPEDHRKNLEQLARATLELGKCFRQNNQNPIGGRVGFRCASPDYLPMVGQVPNPKVFDKRYAGLRKDARKKIDTEGGYLQGLYINTGHGSRGLTSSPWCGEFLASLICNEPLPTSKEISRALLPARFLIRDLIRNKR